MEDFRKQHGETVLIARKSSRGATRIPVRQARPPIQWKYWLRYGVAFTLVAGVIGCGAYLDQVETSPMFPILHVTVDGDFSHVDRKALVEAVTPYAIGGIMSVNVAKLREAGEAIPWVKEIQVKRVWPDSLHLVVEEHHAIALWGQDGLMNDEGKLFFPTKASFPDGLVKLTGPKDSSREVVEQYSEVSRLVATLGLSVKEVEMNERRAWTIKLSNGMNVMLGRTDSEQRLQRFATTYKKLLQPYQEDITAVDMRYTNGLSVAWVAGHKHDFNGTI
ncbi:MAG TPA: cell division protein FtsQ/DivIB [Methylophaga sp.]|nr:cell division protein FtsQ/DivIB [Methylophaga sp.]